jgi:hypothetical protein
MLAPLLLGINIYRLACNMMVFCIFVIISANNRCSLFFPIEHVKRGSYVQEFSLYSTVHCLGSPNSDRRAAAAGPQTEIITLPVGSMRPIYMQDVRS